MPRRKPNKSLNDIVDKLVNNAYQILEWKLIAAMQPRAALDEVPEGLPEGYLTGGYDLDVLDGVLALVTPLLASAQQTRKVEAQTSSDIIKLISKGKISLDEATKLMTLAKIRLDVEEKEMRKKLQDKMMGVLDKELEASEGEESDTEES